MDDLTQRVARLGQAGQLPRRFCAILAEQLVDDFGIADDHVIGQSRYHQTQSLDDVIAGFPRGGLEQVYDPVRGRDGEEQGRRRTGIAPPLVAHYRVHVQQAQRAPHLLGLE